MTVADIDRWHRAKKWDGCGYHYVIYQDGRITPNEYLKQCPCLDAMLEYKDLQPDGFWEGKAIY